MDGRRAVYQAVFPIAREVDTPTPTATPLVDTGSFDSRDFTPQWQNPQDVAAQRIQLERAWHAATAYLTLPRASLTLKHIATRNESTLQGSWLRPCSRAVADAVSLLLQSATPFATTKVHDGARRLVDWYTEEVTSHFVQFQLHKIKNILKISSKDGSLGKVVKLLQGMQRVYFGRIDQTIPVESKAKVQSEFVRFRDRYHAIVFNSIKDTNLTGQLSVFLRRQVHAIFAELGHTESVQTMETDQNENAKKPVAKIKNILVALDNVGLGGAQVQRIVAEVVDDGLTSFVADRFSGIEPNSPQNATKVQAWVDSQLVPLVCEIMACLRFEDESLGVKWKTHLAGEISNWKERAIHELAAMRLEEAFRIVVEWQQDAPHGLDDLLPYTKTMAGRAFIINKFSATIAYRLLHPGASTIQILQVYVHIIMAFLELDPKGVLLDRISRPLRKYLRERPDTVKTIVQGLLLDPTSYRHSDDPIEDLARVLNDLQERQVPERDVDEELYDLNWEPDPIDAAPEYKSDERGEILGSLIDIFDNKEVFVKVFQNMLGDRLLQYEHDFHREKQVLELLKRRIGEAHLQACEVMLRDINDSRRIDEYVMKDQGMNPQATLLKAKVLSRFYWPALQPDDYKVPDLVESLQERYSNGFEHFKNSRKLTWLNTLGQAKVELHLKDRIVKEQVHTWQASVIQAFADLDADGSSHTGKSAEDIAGELQMEEELVHAALSFWVGKLVLRRHGNFYSVLEELPHLHDAASFNEDGAHDDLEASAATASASAAAATVGGIRQNEDRIAEEKMEVFWQFIQNMLRNNGAMPLPRVIMMLKFAVQGGFPYTDDELKTYLARKIDSKQLDFASGKYKMP